MAVWWIFGLACIRSGALPAAPPPPACARVPVNGDLEYTEDGLPTGRIIVWKPPPGEASVVTARIRIGDLEHVWEVGRVTDAQTTFDLVVPPEGIFTSLQELAFSSLYVSIHHTMVEGGVMEQQLEHLAVVWSYGSDAEPVWYTVMQAMELWPGGVVGVEGKAGLSLSQPGNAVRAWMEAYD